MSLSKTSRWTLIVRGTASLAVVVVGVGLLHMPFAKPLLMTVGGCPVGNVSPAVVEAARNDAVRASRGERQAAARPALGFALDEMTLDRVQAWAKASHVACEEKREGTVFKCLDVPVAAFSGMATGDGTIDDVTFGFSVEGKRLVNLTTLRSNLAPVEASQRIGAIASALEQSLGKPSSAAGAWTPESFDATPFATATIAYRFHDFRKEGLPLATVDRWLAATGWETLVNRKGTTWRKLDSATRDGVVDAASARMLMQRETSVVKRPVVEWGEQITVGFDPDRWERIAVR